MVRVFMKYHDIYELVDVFTKLASEERPEDKKWSVQGRTKLMSSKSLATTWLAEFKGMTYPSGDWQLLRTNYKCKDPDSDYQTPNPVCWYVQGRTQLVSIEFARKTRVRFLNAPHSWSSSPEAKGQWEIMRTTTMP